MLIIILSQENGLSGIIACERIFSGHRTTHYHARMVAGTKRLVSEKYVVDFNINHLHYQERVLDRIRYLTVLNGSECICTNNINNLHICRFLAVV